MFSIPQEGKKRERKEWLREETNRKQIIKWQTWALIYQNCKCKCSKYTEQNTQIVRMNS